MSAKFKKIDPRIWSDEGFMKLSAAEKLVALYAITAQSNWIGLFRFSPALAAEQLETSLETFREGFGNVCQRLGWRFDSSVRVLYIPSWFRYNPPDNPNVLKFALRDLSDLPQTTLLDEFAANMRFIPETSLETFRQTLRHTFPERWGEPAGKNKELEIEEEQTLTREVGGIKSGKTKSTNASSVAPKEWPPGFAKFWAAYPNPRNFRRRVEDEKCLKIWNAKDLEPIADQVINALEIEKTTTQWNQLDGKTIPQTTTWLNQSRWRGVETTATQSSKPKAALEVYENN